MDYRAFARNMASTFKSLNIQDTPSIRAIDYITQRLQWVDQKALASALGKAKIEVPTMEVYDILVEEGLLDQFARLMGQIYDYSCAAFGNPNFFIESAGKLELEFK
jgi:hypothetical protein